MHQMSCVAPLESPRSQLSIRKKNIENGYHHETLLHTVALQNKNGLNKNEPLGNRAARKRTLTRIDRISVWMMPFSTIQKRIER